jgi:nitrate/nitrite transporter NarK
VLGPRWTITLGGAVQGTSFVMLWAVSTKLIALPNTGAVMAILVSLSVTQYLGSGLITGAVFASVVRNFPDQRGPLTGLVKGWVGLCGGMLRQTFVGFVAVPSSDAFTLNYTLLCGIACSFVMLPAQWVMNHPIDKRPEAPAVVRRIWFGYQLARPSHQIVNFHNDAIFPLHTRFVAVLSRGS